MVVVNVGTEDRLMAGLQRWRPGHGRLAESAASVFARRIWAL